MAIPMLTFLPTVTELRRTALLYLTREEQLRLFAMDPSIPRKGDEEERQVRALFLAFIVATEPC